jgi:hypothetical protein
VREQVEVPFCDDPYTQLLLQHSHFNLKPLPIQYDAAVGTTGFGERTAKGMWSDPHFSLCNKKTKEYEAVMKEKWKNSYSIFTLFFDAVILIIVFQDEQRIRHITDNLLLVLVKYVLVR